jgi:two-component system, NarL family, response regulator LiaR
MDQPLRVLIVDDHEIVRYGLSMVLSDEPGIELVGEAQSGKDALARAEEMRPDVILMDLVLPDIDGVEVTRRIVQSGSESRIVVLTSFADDRRVRDAIQAGAIGYLLKDVLKPDLLRAIRAAARGEPALHPEAQRHLMRQISEASEPSALRDLTDRERDVLRLIGEGRNNKQIAAGLGLTEGTIKGYVSTVLGKLGVADRTQAALIAVREGLTGRP